MPSKLCRVGETHDTISATLCRTHTSILSLATIICLINSVTDSLNAVRMQCMHSLLLHCLLNLFYSVLQFVKSAHVLCRNMYIQEVAALRFLYKIRRIYMNTAVHLYYFQVQTYFPCFCGYIQR